MARRAGYAHDFADSNGTQIIHVDLGNYFKPIGPTSSLINQLMIESLEDLPMAVLNLAPRDVFLWPQLAAQNLRSCRIISSNLRPRSETMAAPPPTALLELKEVQLESGQPLRIGFAGVADPDRVPPNSGFSAADPAQALTEVLPELRRTTDILIVMADLKEPEVERLIDANPGIDVVLRAEPRYIRHQPRFLGETLLLSSVERARYLGKLTMRIDSAGRLLTVEPELVEMSEGISEDTEFLRKQEALARELP